MTILEKIKKLTGLDYSDEAFIDWCDVCKCPLTEDFIREFKYKVDWDYISEFQNLSEDFIREHKDKVDWDYISVYQKLSEDFIREFQDMVDWIAISKFQYLSEDFIREFQDMVNWYSISARQKLSEDFIREFQDKVDWYYISGRQKLSEDFIREFQNKVNWEHIYNFQRLSEDFIREFQDKVDWECISKYQKLSKSFIQRNEDYLYLSFIRDNWIYKSTEEKKRSIIDTGKYECHEDYFIAHKAIKNDRYSKFNFQYQYLPGQEYESWCDCSKNENSFGLSVGTMEYCKDYADRNDIIVKAQIRYEDVGRVVHYGEKIRCFKFKIID